MAMTALDAVAVARSQRGYVESPPRSNHTKYGVWFGMDPAYWCAMYLSWVWWSIGLRFRGGQSPKGWASAEMMRQWFKRQGLYFSTPRVGDAVFFHIPGGHAGANHVGLVIAVNRDGSIRTSEGNTSTSSDRNGGSVMERTRSGSIILGYGRPRYAPPPVTKPVPVTTGGKWWIRNLMLTSPMTRGTDVAACARRLKAHGYDAGTPVDIFGPQMNNAVRAFQKAKGLKVDGIVGPTTARYLG